MGKRGEKSEDNHQEEKNADQMTVALGLNEPMKNAIKKMIDLNLNPCNNAEMQKRIEVLSNM